ncbi:MAG: zinc ribbon domain-containing protein, partial [Candidatus Thermoplasmatota archaeon]|nr:zinc ribbon domain-containing protein [Candidatus Thermoplasmatota archaeon]
QIFTMILLLLIIITIGLGGYLVYNGTIKLPTQAPPSMGGAEAIYEGDDGKPQRANLPPRESEAEVEELEEVDNMRICSSCGDLVTLGDEICPNCGATFELEEEEDELSFDDEEE